MQKSGFKSKQIAAYVIFLCFFALASCGGKENMAVNVTESANAESPTKRGEQVVAEFLKRDAAPFRKARVRFTIKSEGEPDKIYEIDTWRKQTPEGTTTLSQIIKPEEDSDLASLTTEPVGQKTTVVTYAASRGEFRETDTNKMFFGGLTAGELLGEWGKFDYSLVGEKEAAGRKAYEVEGKLKEGVYSVISHMTILFRQDNYLPAELHLFDNNGREIRTYKVAEFKDDSAHPYASKTVVDNPVYKSQIGIEILSQEFPATLDESIFSREKLKQIVRK